MVKLSDQGMLGVVLTVVVRREPLSVHPCEVFKGVFRENFFFTKRKYLLKKWVRKGKALSQNGCEKEKVVSKWVVV